MAKIHIDIRDDIEPDIALNAVKTIVARGKVSEGEKGKMYYTWAALFRAVGGYDFWVSTRQYRKSDCFVVYKDKRKED